jgi:altronate dehydratase
MDLYGFREDSFFIFVLQAVSGEKTKNEYNNICDIVILKEGVTL